MTPEELELSLRRLAGPQDRRLSEAGTRQRARRIDGRRRRVRVAVAAVLAVVGVGAVARSTATSDAVVTVATAAPNGDAPVSTLNDSSSVPSPQEAFVAAIRRDDDETASKLLGSVDVDEAADFGITPLMIAAMRDNGPMVELLVDAGADIERTSNSGHTALQLAARNDRLVSAAALLTHGADPETRTTNRYESTALMVAVASGHSDMVDLLLDLGCDPSALDGAGRPTIHYALDRIDVSPTTESTFALIERLLDGGATVTEPDGSMVPLAEWSPLEVLEFLTTTDSPRQS